MKKSQTLRGFLTHLQANVRKLAELNGERILAAGGGWAATEYQCGCSCRDGSDVGCLT